MTEDTIMSILKVRVVITILVLLSLTCLVYSKSQSYIKEVLFSSKLTEEEKEDSITKLFFLQENAIKQLEFSNEIIFYAQKINSYNWLYRGNYYKGNSYFYLADADKAYDYYLRSLNIAVEHNILKGIDGLHIDLGSTYSMIGESKKAIQHYKKAIKFIKTRNDNLYLGYTYLNLIDEYQKTNNIDSVHYFLKKTDSIFSNLNDQLGLGYLFGNYAIIYGKQNKVDLSIKNFNLCKKELNALNRKNDINAFKIELAKVFNQKNNSILALVYAKKANSNAKKSNLNEQIRDSAKLLSEIYNKLENTDSAYYYQTQFINYNDSINNEETIRKLANLRAEYEISQKQNEIDILEKQKQITTIILVGVAVFLFAVLLFAFILHKNNRLIKEQKRELEKLNASKDKMFSIVSHDLRGPIHTLAGFSSMFYDMIVKKDTENLMEVTNMMEKSLGNVTNLLDNLLEWAVHQQGQVPFHPEVIDLNQELKTVAEIFSQSAKAKNISIELDLEENLKLTVDKNTFCTIMRNILGNAIKYTHEGGIVSMRSFSDDTGSIVCISDTGIGMNEEKVRNLFKPQDIKSTWGTAREKGIGLGLRLAKEFTELNQGNIDVVSVPGKGTSFNLTF